MDISAPPSLTLRAPRVSVRAVPTGDVTYTVVDLETTGLSPRTDGITEICCLRITGGQVQDRFSTLLHPGRPIPPFIQMMTGITDEMVRDAPTFRHVVPAFLEFLGDSTLVAHNAPFDLGFLNYGLYAAGQPSLHNPVVDTIRLARRLLPELPRRSLDAVTRYLDISIADRHRAEGDAQATAQVLLRLLSIAQVSGIETDAQLMAFLGYGETKYRLAAVTPRADKANRAARLAVLAERCRSLPDAPGVYLMRNSAGSVLYVGKAVSLRKRLSSYFSASATSKTKRLMRQVENIEHRQAGSELEALLEESRLIKEHQPPFNVLLRSYRDYPFIKVEGSGPYPRLSTTKRVSDDDSLYFGPFRGLRTTEMVLEILRKCFRLFDDRCPNHGTRGESCLYRQMNRCLAPCLGGGQIMAYTRAIEQVCALLESNPEELIADLVRRRDWAADSLDFESAAVYRDAIDALAHALSHRRLLTPAIDGLNVLAVCPALQAGWVELFVFGDGRLVSRTRMVADGGIGAAVDGFLADLARRRVASGGRPAVRIDAPSLDQVNIISSWLSRQGAAATTIDLEPGWPDRDYSSIADRVAAAVRATAGLEDGE